MQLADPLAVGVGETEASHVLGPMRLALVLYLALVSVSAAAQSVRIAGLRAALISDHGGSPQPLDLNDPDLWLFNRISADPPSHATRMIVDLAGEPRSYPEGSVMLTARNAETGRQVSRQTATLGGFLEPRPPGRCVHPSGDDVRRAPCHRDARTRGTESQLPSECGE